MQPKIYHASDHDIDPVLIDADALYILKKLKEAGFLAYLVGGSVRDLLVKKAPKDFDISTSARPEEIKRVFQKNCMLIGRRFRLAHIRLGRRIFEVSTFRAGDNDGDLIVHDNIWGSPEEDVLRRDFTINGLFYDPEAHSVIDFVGGWEDIHKRLLRTIGEPTIRFKQDPVRMIRLLKFQARFDFAIDNSTQQALTKCHQEILKSSPARILEEILRMLESGASEPFFKLMNDCHLLELLFPCLSYFLQGNHSQYVYKLLNAADQIHQKKDRKPIHRAVLTACLLFPILEQEIYSTFHKIGQTPNFGQVMMLTSTIIKAVLISSFSHFPKRLSMETNFIISSQYRMIPPAGKRHQNPRLLHNKEFSLALSFLKIRAIADRKLMEDYDWWNHLYRQAESQSNHREHHHAPSSHEDVDYGQQINH